MARATSGLRAVGTQKDRTPTSCRSLADIAGPKVNFRAPMLRPAGPTALAQESDYRLGNLFVSPSRSRDSIRRKMRNPSAARDAGSDVSRTPPRRSGFARRTDCAVLGRPRDQRRCNQSRDRERETVGGHEWRLLHRYRAASRIQARRVVSGDNAAAATHRPGAELLAVLAFDNLSDEADMAFFSDGLSEESSSRLECCALSRVMFMDEEGIRAPWGASMANCRQSSIAVIKPRSKQKSTKIRRWLPNRVIAFWSGGGFLPIRFCLWY